MKKFIIPLLTVVVLVSIIFAGCVPAVEPAPPVTPPPVTPPPVAPPVTPPAPELSPLERDFQTLIVDAGLVDPGITLNPFGEDFAVKPDGTPYFFACSVLFLGVDTLAQGEKFQHSLIERAGGDYIFFDPGLNAEKQIGWIEDMMVAARKPDIFIFQAVNENMLVPVVDAAWNAGIPSVIWDIDVFTDNKVTFILHDFAGLKGSNQVGQYFVDRAEAENRELVVLEIWGQRMLQTSQDRHTGFHRAVDPSPLITVIESVDSNWSPEAAANITMDMMLAHPEIGGIFSHGGEAPGVVEGLRSIGQLLPLNDPNHIIIATNDIDTLVAKSIDDRLVDACGSHQANDLMSISTMAAFTHVVLGQPVPKRIAVPMYIITPDNINTLRMLGLPTYPKLPPGRWEIWPPEDPSLLGFPQPTKELRMEYLGY